MYSALPLFSNRVTGGCSEETINDVTKLLVSSKIAKTEILMKEERWPEYSTVVQLSASSFPDKCQEEATVLLIGEVIRCRIV